MKQLNSWLLWCLSRYPQPISLKKEKKEKSSYSSVRNNKFHLRNEVLTSNNHCEISDERVFKVQYQGY